MKSAVLWKNMALQFRLTGYRGSETLDVKTSDQKVKKSN